MVSKAEGVEVGLAEELRQVLYQAMAARITFARQGGSRSDNPCVLDGNAGYGSGELAFAGRLESAAVAMQGVSGPRLRLSRAAIDDILAVIRWRAAVLGAEPPGQIPAAADATAERLTHLGHLASLEVILWRAISMHSAAWLRAAAPALLH